MVRRAMKSSPIYRRVFLLQQIHFTELRKGNLFILSEDGKLVGTRGPNVKNDVVCRASGNPYEAKPTPAMKKKGQKNYGIKVSVARV